MPRRDLAGEPSEARKRMWSAIRMLKTFRIAQLIEISSAPRKCAEKFLRALMRAGYVAGDGKRGCAGQSYRLLRDTGPFAPRAGRTGVTLDPNEAITRERARRKEILAELARCEERLERLGAYVDRAAARVADIEISRTTKRNL